MDVNQNTVKIDEPIEEDYDSFKSGSPFELETDLATSILIDTYYLNEWVKILHLTKDRVRLKVKQLNYSNNLSQYLFYRLLWSTG